MWLNENRIPTALVSLTPALTVTGSVWEGHCGLPLERRWLPALSVRTEHVLFDGLGVKTFGDLLALDVLQILSARNAGTKTVKEIIALRDEVFKRGPAEYEAKKAGEEASEATHLPPAAIERLSVRAQHVLTRNGIVTYAQLLALISEDTLMMKGCGAKTLHELKAFAKACGVEKKEPVVSQEVKPINPAVFSSFAEYVLGVADAKAVARMTGNYLVVLTDSLALGTSSEKQTLDAVGKKLNVTRERVRQIGATIVKLLFGGIRKERYRPFADMVEGLFRDVHWVIRSDDLKKKVDACFGWKDTALVNLVSLMACFGHKIEENEFGWCGLDVEQHQVELPIPVSEGKKRRRALLEVLRTAGPSGLTLEEILQRCNTRFPDLSLTLNNVRGLVSNAAKLDAAGTRVIGYNRGRTASERTTFTLNAFFRDQSTLTVLEKAGADLKSYMEDSGFGTISIWKTWLKYRSELPVDLPKFGFYSMLRDIKAAGLVYREYPRVTHPDAEYCEAACQWELYEYFNLCDRPSATYYQILDFFVECLCLDPVIATACAIPTLGLKAGKLNDLETETFEIPMPKGMEGRFPNVLLAGCEPDPSLPFCQARRRRLNIVSADLDEQGHAKTILAYVRLFFYNLQESRYAFTKEELAELGDAGWCATNLDVHKPVVVPFKKKMPPPSLGYWREPFDFGGVQAYVNSTWYPRRKAKFDIWAERLAVRAGIDFEPYDLA